VRTKPVPGQNYQGVIGYRVHLGWRDALRVLFGAPVLIGLRLITPIPVPNIRTDATVLVGGKPAHRGTTFEVVDIPPGGNHAAPVA
jgi:hypothetical protein